jgi:DNA-binding response OmpR family regulator
MRSKILIVDNEKETRHRCRQEFEAQGYEVITAQSGHDALRKLSSEPVDLVVLELVLKDGSGIDYLEKMVHAKRHLKFVINTANPTYKMDFHTWAADAYLTKSTDLSELKQTVDKILH